MKVHVSFLLVFALFAFPNAGQEHFLTIFLWDSLFIILLFLCVILHEFGHALMARRFGVGTREIILLPVGGLALLNHLPEKPGQELLIALAGPAVNVGIALLLSLYFIIFPLSDLLPYAYLSNGPTPVFSHPQLIIPILAATNVMLGLFNLLPAFPMDGGRVLRALLALRMPRLRATRIASLAGQVFSLCFVGLAFLLSSPVIGLIGIFIFLAARREVKMVTLSKLLHGETLEGSRLLLPPIIFFEWQPLRDALSALLPNQDDPFLVVNELGRPVGVLHPQRLQATAGTDDYDQPLGQLMSKGFTILSSEVTLHAAVEVSGPDPIVVIGKDEKPIALLSRASLARLISALSAQ